MILKGEKKVRRNFLGTWDSAKLLHCGRSETIPTAAVVVVAVVVPVVAAAADASKSS